MAAKKESNDEPTAAEKKTLKAELVNQLITLSTAGFGFVAALAWNTAIQNLVKVITPKQFVGSSTATAVDQANLASELPFQLIYAVIITIIAVLITYQLSRLAARFQHKPHD